MNYYIIMNNIPGFAIPSCSQLTKAVAGDNSIARALLRSRSASDRLPAGAGQWAMANLNRDDGLFGGTLTFIPDTIRFRWLPTWAQQPRSRRLGNLANIAKAMADAILADEHRP
ncbi:MAG: hypothetical protein ACLVJ6_13740 [Merdibacter sp.]